MDQAAFAYQKVLRPFRECGEVANLDRCVGLCPRAVSYTHLDVYKRQVQDWLAKHPRFNMHFTPTSASWLNMVERFFRDITTERLRRGVFTSVPELIGTIDKYLSLIHI